MVVSSNIQPFLGVYLLAFVICVFVTRRYFKALASELEFNDIGIVTGGMCLFAVVFSTGGTVIGLIKFFFICLTSGVATCALAIRDEPPFEGQSEDDLLDGRDDYGRLNLILIVGLTIAVVVFPNGSFIGDVPIIGVPLLVLGFVSIFLVSISLIMFRTPLSGIRQN